MNDPRILIAEDDQELRNALLRGLNEEGFDVWAAATAAHLLELTEIHPPDALIVDIGLPDADGRDLCQAIRTNGVTAPIVFLTARDALPDRLSGFAAGGDDYLTKPFAFAELVARLHALIRRNSPPPTDSNGVTIDPVTHRAHYGGDSVALTPTEYRILAVLVTHRGAVMRRHELILVGWPHGAIVHDNTLDAYIARLRRKLHSLPGAPGITTIYGVGYSLP